MDDALDTTQFGRYKTVKKLGRGATSTVYQAIDPILNRVVAIKAINPSLNSQPGFTKRFEREATSLARLHHPNIVDIYDLGQEKDIFYMVIRFLSNGTLKEKLQSLKQSKRFMPVEQIVAILSGICDAVDYIHRAGFIHRDLKPSNVMFDDQDNPILADFGIVKALEGQSFTVMGGILGTPFYMSPEQFTGNKIENTSDIYSLGVMAYEMCTGNLPYKSTKLIDIINAQLHQLPPPPTQFNPSLPPILTPVSLKVLAKDPADRYQTCDEFLKAFSSALPSPHQDNLPSSDPGTEITQPPSSAFLKSISTGVRYKLYPSKDNRIGRSKPDKPVDVDLSVEKGSDFVHSLHAIIRLTNSGWELETPSTIENPVFINHKKINPGEKRTLSNDDQIEFSLTKLVIEIE